eukprot:769971_1
MNLFEQAEEEDPFGDVERQEIDYHELAEKQKAEQESSSNTQQTQMKSKPAPSMLSKKDVERMRAIKMKMAVSNAVNKVLAEEEAKMDHQIEKLSRMDEDDLEELRAKRLEELKKKTNAKSKMVSKSTW